jgi:uncharacterized membrane protein SirB2
MFDAAQLKLVHQGAVLVSALGFFARGIGALRGSRWVRTRAARTLPHLVDTVLLASALALAWTMQLNPVDTPWLGAKIGGLLGYVALGMLALRPGRPTALRAAAWVASLLVLGWIVSVAVTKDPLGALQLLRLPQHGA